MSKQPSNEEQKPTADEVQAERKPVFAPAQVFAGFRRCPFSGAFISTSVQSQKPINELKQQLADMQEQLAQVTALLPQLKEQSAPKKSNKEDKHK